MNASNSNFGKKQPAGTRALVILVISMGLMLFGGMGLLITQLASAPVTDNDTTVGCASQRYQLAQGERAQILAVQDTIVALEITSSGDAKTLRQIELCSGEVVSELVIGR